MPENAAIILGRSRLNGKMKIKRVYKTLHINL